MLPQDILSIQKKLKLLEEEINFLKKSLESLEADVIKIRKNFEKFKEDYDKDFLEHKKRISDIQKKLDLIENTIRNMATKEELKVIENYLDLVNPMNFVTVKEVKKLVEDYVKEILKREKSTIE